MGGYALYVWGAYGAGIIVLVALAVTPKIRRRRPPLQ